MNLHKTLKTAVTKLNHLENPSLEAEVLLASLLDKHRTWLRTYPETKLSATQHLKYKWWIQQRAAHKPVAYITGNVVWNSLSLKVNKHTLIPRDETEILCHHIKTAQTISPKTILDIGTGSGCIAIWLKKQFPSAQVSAFDIAKNALKLAKKNAKQNQTEIKFAKSDLTQILPNKTKIDVIVANLPYVPENLIVTPEVDQEPPTAIFSGTDGLDHIRALQAQITDKSISFKQLWLEFLPSQTDTIKSIFSDYKVEFKPGVNEELFFALITPRA